MNFGTSPGHNSAILILGVPIVKIWSVEGWDTVQSYIDKLTEKCEMKKERKIKLKSSYSFISGFTSPLAVPLIGRKFSLQPDPSGLSDVYIHYISLILVS